MFGLGVCAAIFLCLTGMGIAFVICADHLSEFFNGWNYRNNWDPFSGGYIDAVRELPGQLYIGLKNFPDACFFTLILYPMIVIFVAFYEVVHNDFSILLMGWLPFLSGVALFILGGFFFLREPDNPNMEKFKKI